eukprot:12545043-Ditylum_brightwellii.AAC.1
MGLNHLFPDRPTKCKVNQESLCQAEGGLHVVFCNAILMSSTNTREIDSLTMCSQICFECLRYEDTIVGMETLDRMANGAGLFVNNTFALQNFNTVKENLVECKDHLRHVICEQSVAIKHNTGVRSSAKSATSVLNHILIQRHPITRVQIFSGEIADFCAFGLCSAAQDPMHLGKYTGCILGNRARVSPWLTSSHHIWAL